MTTAGKTGSDSTASADTLSAPEYRILVIDDNPQIHQDFKKILMVDEDDADPLEDVIFGSGKEAKAAPVHGSFAIDSAFQGKDGLEMVKRSIAENRPYALCFMDMRMPPGWDGIETTKHVWQADPHLQIVICTAFSDYSWADMARNLGQTDNWVILKKPFDMVEALQLVHSLTAKWNLARQARQRLEALDSLVAQRTEQLSEANRKLEEDIAMRKQAQTHLSAFATLGDQLSSARTAKEAAKIIVDISDQLFGWDSCICALYSPERDELSHLLSIDVMDGKRKECTEEFDDLKPSKVAEKAIREGGQLILREDFSTTMAGAEPFGDTGRASASILYVPIRNGGKVIGILSIQSYTPRAYDECDLETFQALADHCGGALSRLEAEEALHEAEQQLRQAQKLEAIGQLAGGVAHDFNNLLAVILMNGDMALAKSDQLPPDVTEALKQILAAADKSARLTTQLLAFGRKQVVHSEALDLNKLIGRVSSMLSRIVGEDIEIKTSGPEDLPAVHADASMMDQVIMNLVVNARDAMPSGGKIFISTETAHVEPSRNSQHSERRRGDFVCLTVRDTGSGIPPEIMARIFEPFFTTKEVGKGTGLGLATVFGIVKQHRGWVEVSSTVGVGTEFKVYLPVRDQNPER